MTAQEAGGGPAELGPYRTLDVLGQGGMGVVYRGTHRETGEQVAIKTVHVGLAANLSAIRREIHALSRLEHPGIVRVVAQGLTRGLPWYAMELVSGRALDDHLDELWSRVTVRAPKSGCAPAGPTLTMEEPGTPCPRPPTSTLDDLPPRGGHEGSGAGPTSERRVASPRVPQRGLQDMLALIRRVCAPLGFLHGSGIVHRDVKPENVLVRPDGSPVLVDLGIAVRFGGAVGREELAAEGRAMGSIPYLAPELIRGDLVDARADLYALGCTLYECITGRPPFLGSTDAVLYQHVTRAPVPPSERVEGIPAALDLLVLALLQKRPQDRLGYADDVASALASLGADAPEPASSRRARPYVYRPELTGRESAMRDLERAVAGLAGARTGGLVLVGGESGVGKTRLVMEAARVAQRRGLTVVAGQCVVALGAVEGHAQPDVGASPLHPLRPLLVAVADRCRELGSAGAAELLGARAGVLVAYEPALAGLPGTEGEPEQGPESLSPQYALARALDALQATLFAFAKRTPVLLLLDDLQWADELTLAFLDRLSAAELAERGVLLIGTFRVEEMRAPLAALVHGPGVVHVELGRLDAAGVGAMVSGMLALPAPLPELTEFLGRQSDGNPFFVAEYLRAAIGAGLLTRSRTGAWRLGDTSAPGSFGAALPLPRTLAELIVRRLGDVGDEALALAQMAAVLGRELDVELLATAMDRGDGTADAGFLEGLEILRVRQVLEEAGPGRLRFVHDKLRELAYEPIPEARRRVLHRRAADAIERREAGEPDAWPALGHHFANAAVPDRASYYFGRAAAHLRRAHANREAIGAFRAAVASGRLARAEGATPETVPLEPLAALLERLADLLVVVGRHEEARDTYAEARGELAGSARVEASRIHRKVVDTLVTQHQHDEALRACDAAEGALGAEPPGSDEAWQDEWVEVQLARIAVGYWHGRVEANAVLLAKIRGLVEHHARPALRSRFFQALAHISIDRERYVVSAQTLSYTRAAFAASEEAGDAEESTWVAFGFGVVLLLRGALDEADERLRAGLWSSEERGNLPMQARHCVYLATLERVRGHVAEVRDLALRTLETAVGAGMTMYASMAHGHLAWVALREGDLPGVFAEGERAIELWTGLAHAFRFRWTALFPMLAGKLELGQVEEALGHARAMLDEQQHRLPEQLSALLLEATTARLATSARAALDATLEPARSLGYL